VGVAASPLGSLMRHKRWAPYVIHAILLVSSLILLFPLAWMAITSLKPIDQTMAFPPSLIPHPFQWRNYLDAVTTIPFLRYTMNTLLVCTLGVIGAVLSNALVAYSFARLTWPGRDMLFGITLATMMVPFPVLMVPLYSVFRELGWIGTLKPLWVPAFFGSAFNIFLLRQFFLRVPKDIAEAATLDGAGEFTIFWRIYLPLAKPALAVVALFHFIWAWNDFLGPLLYLTEQKTFTLSLGLQFYQSQHGGTQWHLLMAASTLAVLPMVILFFLTQKTFLRGITFMKNVDIN